jgi:hypothetical protein
MGLSCLPLPLSLYTRESQMGKTTPQIMPTDRKDISAIITARPLSVHRLSLSRHPCWFHVPVAFIFLCPAHMSRAVPPRIDFAAVITVAQPSSSLQE